MSFISLIMTEEASMSCIRELGILGCIQFIDLNPEVTAFQREHVANIKRCDEIERKIRYVYSEVKRLGLMSSSTASVEDFIANARSDSINNGTGAYILESLENRLELYEGRLKELVDYNTQLSEQYTKKVEYHHLLVQAQRIVRAASEIESKESAVRAAGFLGVTGDKASIEDGEVRNPLMGLSSDRHLSSGATSSYQDADSAYQIGESSNDTGNAFGGEDSSMSFSNISGVLGTAERQRFERMLFRSTRGNCYVRFATLATTEVAAMDADGNPIEKLAFVIFFKSAAIESKIIRICDAFGATRYDLRMLNNAKLLEGVRRSNYQELLDSKAILDKNTNMRQTLCSELADTLEESLWVVRREKAVYHALNMFKSDLGGRLVRGQGWITTNSIPEAKQALHRAHLLLNLPQNSLLERVSGHWPTPPTHFKTNKYTYAFQEFVNTYGMPRYREINPALFTAATFPFLFGMMYGDIGHGSVLTMAALYLVFTESRIRTARSMDEMIKNVYTARYMLLAMGICSVYAGLLYNDYFSLGLDLFGSKYQFLKSEEELKVGDKARLKQGKIGDPAEVYPVGIDPIWHVSSNELLFFNSMKMKMSVIMGIAQMTLGIVLRGINSVYVQGFGLDFFTEFLPMIIFDLALFGYMVVLIFLKWGTNWNERMALGSCQYDKHGTFGACNLSASNKSCYSVSGMQCTSTTPLADICPLDYGGSGDGCQPPNLITTLINIALKPGQVEDPLYPGQAQVQIVLLVIAFACVPWLLCAKPYLLNKAHNERTGNPSHGYEGLLSHTSDHPNDDDNAELNIQLSEFNRASSYGRYDSRSETFGTSAAGGSKGGSYDMNDEIGRYQTNITSLDFTSDLPGNGAYDESSAGSHGHGDEEFNFGEIFIHQAIETIEFVLGMVSNTASYLRLWALSLAHTELSQVFWQKCLVGAIESGNPIAIFFGFAVFAAITTGVLLFMDVLECFLHALRLHWVEFQNKFYKADGHRFVPFDFSEILSHAKLD